MSWFDRILEAVQTAAIIGERVERLGNSVAEIATELRDMDRRIARLEGAIAVGSGLVGSPPDAASAPPSGEDRRS